MGRNRAPGALAPAPRRRGKVDISPSTDAEEHEDPYAAALAARELRRTGRDSRSRPAAHAKGSNSLKSRVLFL